MLLFIDTVSFIPLGSVHKKTGLRYAAARDVSVDRTGVETGNAVWSATIDKNNAPPDNNKRMRAPYGYRMHIDSYRRALFYIERQLYQIAATILRNDLKKTKDPYDCYESYSLLLGMHIDRRAVVSEEELEGFICRFKKVQVRAPRDVKRTKRFREKVNRITSPSKNDTGKRDKRPRVNLHENQHSRLYEDPWIFSYKNTPPGLYMNQHERLHDTLPGVLLDYLSEKQKRIEAVEKDLFQFERMAGDYFYNRSNTERAFVLYSAYYNDLHRPISSFVSQSMRSYIDILWRKRDIEKALFYQGFLVNLKPYMFTELFHLARMYYLSGDRQNSLFLIMFANTLAEGYSASYYTKTGEQMLLLLEEMKNVPQEKSAREVAGIYLTGKNLQAMPSTIETLGERGIENPFFSYLEGLSFYLKKDYKKALHLFETFNGAYPWLADSYYYAMLCMNMVDPAAFDTKIIDYAHKTAELKPHSFIAKMTRIFIGRKMGLNDEESRKLLFPQEITGTIEDFARNGAPVGRLSTLAGILSISKNPYQVFAIQRMSGITVRRDEYVGFLKDTYSSGNNRCRQNIEKIMHALGEKFE